MYHYIIIYKQILTCTKIALKVAGFFHTEKLGQFEVSVNVWTAADLGMFSMFGRTGAPTRGAANFLHAGNNGRHRSEGLID